MLGRSTRLGRSSSWWTGAGAAQAARGDRHAAGKGASLSCSEAAARLMSLANSAGSAAPPPGILGGLTSWRAAQVPRLCFFIPQPS